MYTRREADGDWHIGLRLNAGQESLLNAKNVSEQQGNLVAEIVCAVPITQADAVSACASYTNTIPVPAVGAHISVTGPFVLDADHGWNEIHPVWALTNVTPSSPEASGAALTPVPTVVSSAASGSFTVAITVSRYGLVGATTAAGATCTAQARLPSGRVSTAQGLQGSKTADSSGNVQWSYGTTTTTTPGTGTHTVTCTDQSQTISASAPFSVP